MMKKEILCLAAAILLMLTAASAFADIGFEGWSVNEQYQYVSFGNYPYDRSGTVAPVVWKVLSVSEDGLALLMTNEVIDGHPFLYPVEGTENLKKKEYRQISGYEDSDLYTWMNSEMLNTLFTAEEQNALDESRGKLFILTKDEYLITDYGFPAAVYGVQKRRVAAATGYAKSKGVYMDTDYKGATYWTATIRQNETKAQAQIVGYNGHISWAGFARENVGIRPCTLVKTQSVSFAGGSGTLDDPYIVMVNP